MRVGVNRQYIPGILPYSCKNIGRYVIKYLSITIGWFTLIKSSHKIHRTETVTKNKNLQIAVSFTNIFNNYNSLRYKSSNKTTTIGKHTL